MALIDCKHCGGSGKCSCSGCQMKWESGTNKKVPFPGATVPCAVCGGKGKVHV